MGSGAQYVMITGIPMMHKWCVDNWDMMDVSAPQSNYYLTSLILFQFPYHFKIIQFYQMNFYYFIIWTMFIAVEMKIC